jgi:TetR/AcrR family transcriptional repressor of nem operon
MRHFWADGSGAAPMRDLVDAMELDQASVYNAFGGKRALFIRCLDRYLDANMRARISRLEHSLPPRPAIEAFLAEIIERLLEMRLVCLLADAAREVAPRDPDIAEVIADRMGELEAFFRRCAIASQGSKTIASDVNTTEAARLLRVLARGHPERAVLEGARQTVVTRGKRREPFARE